MKRAVAAQVALDREDPFMNACSGTTYTVGDYAARMLNETAVRNTTSTLRFRRRTVDLLYGHVDGGWPPGAVTMRICHEFVLERERAGDSASTVRKRIGVLRRMFARALEDHALESNPWAGITGPPEPVGAPTYMTREEVDAIYLAAPLERRFRYLFLLETGVRIVEARRAVWGDVDSRHRRLYVRNAQKGKGSRLALRKVPFGAKLGSALSNRRLGKKMPIFPGPLDSSAWRRDLAKDCEAAGVERFVPSDFRDTFASWLVQAGVKLQKVRDLMGHESVRTTERYGHLRPGADEGIVEALALNSDCIDHEGHGDTEKGGERL